MAPLAEMAEDLVAGLTAAVPPVVCRELVPRAAGRCRALAISSPDRATAASAPAAALRPGPLRLLVGHESGRGRRHAARLQPAIGRQPGRDDLARWRLPRRGGGPGLLAPATGRRRGARRRLSPLGRRVAQPLPGAHLGPPRCFCGGTSSGPLLSFPWFIHATTTPGAATATSSAVIAPVCNRRSAARGACAGQPTARWSGADCPGSEARSQAAAAAGPAVPGARPATRPGPAEPATAACSSSGLPGPRLASADAAPRAPRVGAAEGHP